MDPSYPPPGPLPLHNLALLSVSASNTSFLRCLSLRFRGGTLLTSHLNPGPAAQAESGRTLPLKEEPASPRSHWPHHTRLPWGPIGWAKQKSPALKAWLSGKDDWGDSVPPPASSSASLSSFWPISLPRKSSFSQFRSVSDGKGLWEPGGPSQTCWDHLPGRGRIGNEPLGWFGNPESGLPAQARPPDCSHWRMPLFRCRLTAEPSAPR